MIKPLSLSTTNSLGRFILLSILLVGLCQQQRRHLYFANAETVHLADCPQEPDVVGVYYNNGQKCIRDRVVLSRNVVEATCPDSSYTYRNDRCRKRFHPSAKPQCPEGYQRYNNECHENCPTRKHKASKGRCTLPKSSLPTKYMTCPKDDDNHHGLEQHRYQAYCCTMGVDCPKIECLVGDDVPGRFTLDESDGICRRLPQTLARITSMKPRFEPCPDPLIQVWGVCQDPCPAGFQTTKGKCEIRSCEYDPRNDGDVVTCPEGVYTVAKAMV
mmetsp:Transcript_121184/g.181012  ORF Transcript_121184/g.181012 Transcript_121184/m.181012 type:complete len:272 (+) Transcript_121184:80-895(+)|eukprot:CAMPEP_0116997774 /NCGR_PEP_ID=MMETSP0472-20121206/1090_1 /TAXON_ID=693140 ORGANISM="Tiarina fusus, Strain LIS" /NCGR_SAMPLE_ID=MMETSP0472 /ASSEMBLY_ACC=CAM_ASM_000603 /LENGTH=271 /DNA_ID=CAMNT_0004696751 /DNA_START=80 /DNA_END=895 /DNA_ORIENTATION=+